MDARRKELLNKLRAQCLTRGCGGIKHISTAFRKMDIDYSKKICLNELSEAVNKTNLGFSDDDIKLLFDVFDCDRNGGIDFCEFMLQLRPPMSHNRISVINEAFDKLDVNKDEEIRLDDLQVVYAANARRHPKFVSGEWTEEETLQHFLDSIDTPGCPDGKVTREEFLNYYAGVSATVDDDCYFDLVMRSCYNLPPKKILNT